MNDFPQPESVESIKAAFTEDKMDFCLTKMAEAYTGLAARQAANHTPVRKEATAGRNDPCPCGSGEKFKKCCIK